MKATTTTALLRALLWLGASMRALGADIVRIMSVDEFIQFKDSVNGGMSYYGKTVSLDSDLSLAGKIFEPIGTYSNYFRGTFDGQGHVISNLVMTSSSQYAGLFGYSYGLTIKNVILDSSCSITSSFSSSFGDARIGGIIGYCNANDGPCTIENSVNMGSVTFRGCVSGVYSLHLGGIAGYLSPSNYGVTVKNCVNYGDVTDSGTRSYNSCIGGIVGRSYSSSSSNSVYIYNSINHGTITHNDTASSYLEIGGIVGEADSTTIENCVSGGKISLLTTTSNSNRIGSIVGYASSDTSISYTYFTSDLSGYKKYGGGTPSSVSNILSYDNITFELSETVSIGGYSGTSLIGALNAADDFYYYLREYPHWLLNKGKNAVSFTINKNSPFTIDYQIILLPSLANEGSMSFDGWYTDEELTTPLTEYEVTSDTELYGRWEENFNNYTITFDTRGGIPMEPITAQYGSTVVLGNATGREGWDFLWWETEYGYAVPNDFVVPPYNITLYACWICTRILSAEDLIAITETVNDKNKTFSGTTIYLDSDIDFGDDLSQKFNPIGESSDVYFSGTFDGRGHTISNLVINRTNYYLGLFGYTKSAAIRNVVIDSSCSFSMHSMGWITSGKGYIGGVVGLVKSDTYGSSLIENSVNLANIAINNPNYNYNDFSAGGIAGRADALRNEVILRNCANYGEIGILGENGRSFYGGGIVGMTKGSSNITINNCLNRGPIHLESDEHSFYSYVGGIIGRNDNEYYRIENCVSAGLIPSYAGYKGAIVGYSFYYNTLMRCFWTKETGVDYVSRSYAGYVNDTHSITVNEQSVRDLSSYAAKRGWNKWLFNRNKGNVTFAVNNDGKESFGIGWTVTGSDIVLRTDPVDSVERAFSGWFRDGNFDTAFTGYVVNEPQTMLYGRFCSLAVIFDAGEIPVFPKHKGIIYGKKYGELPNPEKTGYLCIGWDSEEGLITSESVVTINGTHTVYAAFVINNFTLTFDFKNGTKTSTLVTFNDAIVYPENVSREGYSFEGWNDTVERMPGYDLTISAVWYENKLPSRVLSFIIVPCVISGCVIAMVIVLFTVHRKEDEGEADYDLNAPLGQFSENLKETL